MHQSLATTSPRGPGIAGLKNHDFTFGVSVVPWICPAFHSRQNSSGNRGAFLPGFTGI